MNPGRLTAIMEQVARLRGLPVAEAAAAVADMLPELAWLATNPQIDDESAINVIGRAHRAVQPRANRADSPQTALAALQAALAEGPRRPGRPTIGPPVTVRLPESMWDAVDAVAAAEGMYNTDGEPIRAEAIRLLVDEALTARHQLGAL